MSADGSEAARVLVVDDDPGSLDLVADVLRPEGVAVTRAGNGRAALDQARSGAFHVIISDQKMPGMTGLEFFHQVRLIQPDASRVLMTGLVDVDLVVGAINTGEVFRFVIKPWIREEFLSIVRDAVHRHDLVRAAARHRHEVEGLCERVDQLERANRGLEQQVRTLTDRCQQLASRLPEGDPGLDKAIYNARGLWAR